MATMLDNTFLRTKMKQTRSASDTCSTGQGATCNGSCRSTGQRALNLDCDKLPSPIDDHPIHSTPRHSSNPYTYKRREDQMQFYAHAYSTIAGRRRTSRRDGYRYRYRYRFSGARSARIDLCPFCERLVLRIAIKHIHHASVGMILASQLRPGVELEMKLMFSTTTI